MQHLGIKEKLMESQHCLREFMRQSAYTKEQESEPAVRLKNPKSGERSLLHSYICHFNSRLQSWLRALGFSLQPKLK